MMAVLDVMSWLNMLSSICILSGRRLTAGLLNMNMVRDRVSFTLSVSPRCRVLLFESVGAGLLSARQFRFRLRSATSCVRIPCTLMAMVNVRLMSTVTSRGRASLCLLPAAWRTVLVLDVHWEFW